MTDSLPGSGVDVIGSLVSIVASTSARRRSLLIAETSCRSGFVSGISILWTIIVLVIGASSGSSAPSATPSPVATSVVSLAYRRRLEHILAGSGNGMLAAPAKPRFRQPVWAVLSTEAEAAVSNVLYKGRARRPLGRKQEIAS
jgi:hypothetical protein